jgi:hypothetical protein
MYIRGTLVVVKYCPLMGASAKIACSRSIWNALLLASIKHDEQKVNLFLASAFGLTGR